MKKNKLKYYNNVPTYLEVNIEYKPIAMYILIVINVLVYILVYWYCKWDKEIYTDFLYNKLAIVSSKIKEGEYWRLLTAVFIHFDFKHIFYNMSALFGFSLEYEKKEGSLKYIFVYLVSGLISSIASFAAGDDFSGGASGAIFGIVGVISAEIVQELLSGKKKIIDDRKSQILVAIIYPIMYLIPGFTETNVNNIAHVSGALTGIVASFVFDKDKYKYKRVLSVLSSILLIISITFMLAIGFK